MTALSFAIRGVQAGQIKLEQLAWPLSLADRTLGEVLSGKPATFSWQELLQGHPLPAKQLRHFIGVQPTLDFAALQPGQKAEAGIRRAAADLDLQNKFGATVDLTGRVPMEDEQFSVISSASAWRSRSITSWRGAPENRVAAIEPHQGGGIQRHDHRGCVWKHVGVELSGHVQHGQADGAVPASRGPSTGSMMRGQAGSDGLAAGQNEKRGLSRKPSLHLADLFFAARRATSPTPPRATIVGARGH